MPVALNACNVSGTHAARRRERLKAGAAGLAAGGVLAALIVVGSRNLQHFDAALVGYTFALEPWEDFPFNRGMLCPKG